MITKNTENYKKAQDLANEISFYASTNKKNNNSFFDSAFESLGYFIERIKELNVFASKIADTVDATMSPYGYSVAKISSKQAWIIACAAVENNIKLK